MNENQWSKGIRQLISGLAHHPLYSLVYLGYRLLKILGLPVSDRRIM